MHVKAVGDSIVVRHSSLARTVLLNREVACSPYDVAYGYAVKHGMEISTGTKLQVLENIASYEGSVAIDFSGGDPLVVNDNIGIMKHAASVLGRENIGISSTGIGLRRYDVGLLANIVSRVDFTYDSSSYWTRPSP